LPYTYNIIVGGHFRLDKKQYKLKDLKLWLEPKSNGNVLYVLSDEKYHIIKLGTNLLDIVNYAFRISRSEANDQLITDFIQFKEASILVNNFDKYLRDLLKHNIDNQQGTLSIGSLEWLVIFIEDRVYEKQNAVREINNFMKYVIDHNSRLDKTRPEVCKMYNFPMINLE
jgi:hypothetical protein